MKFTHIKECGLIVGHDHSRDGYNTTELQAFLSRLVDKRLKYLRGENKQTERNKENETDI